MKILVVMFMYSAFRLEVAQSAAGPDLAFHAFLHYTYYVLKLPSRSHLVPISF